MMNLLEEAIIYATIMHQGKVRKIKHVPYILHSLEVAQILSTMTDDPEVITAGILHDILYDTDGTLKEIENRFGGRVADLVLSNTEHLAPFVDKSTSWERRKEESIRVLKNSKDIGVKMLWLADKLANIRSLAGSYSEQGEIIWESLDQQDSKKQRWFYKTVAEILELNLNRTGAFKEFLKHINFIWPGTFDSEKARYKKYKEVSLIGCKKIGSGAKGDVYRYDDELIVKVYNNKNTYKEVETEIAQSRKAFIMGIPTAISFGVVAVGDKYGAMFELLNCSDISGYIANDPDRVEYYAEIMADLAHTIHNSVADEDSGFEDGMDRIREQVYTGIDRRDPDMAARIMALIDALPETRHIVHGDFHTGNVFLQNDEPMLIDMDRLSLGHPIVDISGLYMAYVGFGEKDPSVVEKYMGFSYDTAKKFFRYFMEHYLNTKDEETIQKATDKAALLCYMRLVRRVMKKPVLSDAENDEVDRLIALTGEYLDRVDNLVI